MTEDARAKELADRFAAALNDLSDFDDDDAVGPGTVDIWIQGNVVDAVFDGVTVGPYGVRRDAGLDARWEVREA